MIITGYMNEKNDAQLDAALENTSTTIGMTLGQQLKLERESFGLNVSQIAYELNLTTDMVTALEQGDYSSMHGDTFVKGYIRSYARLFGMNFDQELAELELDPVDLGDMPISKEALRKRGQLPSSRHSRSKRRFRLLKLIALIIVIALVLLAVNKLIIGTDMNQLSDQFRTWFGLPVAERSKLDNDTHNQLQNSPIRIE